MDRTAEFLSTVEIMRQHAYGPELGGLRQHVKLSPLPPLHKTSVELVLQIKTVGKQVIRLYQLAHKKGLFDDPSAEINELTTIIKRNLQSLDGRLRGFVVEASRQRAGSAAAAMVNMLLSVSFAIAGPRTHWLSMADILKNHVMALTKLFQETLRVRSENMREHAARRGEFVKSNWAGPGGQLRRRGGANGNPVFGYLLQTTGPSAPTYTSQQLARYQDVSTRAANMKKVEATVVELGHMFTRMAGLVAEQGETVDRIDVDTQEVHLHMQEGHAQLLKYLHSVNGNRWLILKLLGMLAFIIVLFAIFK